MTALRRRMIEAMRIRNYAPANEEAYVQAAARFAQHFGKCPEALGAKEVREYLVYLVNIAEMEVRARS